MTWHVRTTPTRSVICNPLKSGKLFFTLFNRSWPSLCCCCTFKLTMMFWWNLRSLYLSFIFLILVMIKAVILVKNIIEKYIGPYILGLIFVNWMPDKSWKCTVSKNDPRRYLELKRIFFWKDQGYEKVSEWNL